MSTEKYVRSFSSRMSSASGNGGPPEGFRSAPKPSALGKVQVFRSVFNRKTTLSHTPRLFDGRVFDSATSRLKHDSSAKLGNYPEDLA